MYSYHGATFYPVGQGLFTAGRFVLGSDPPRRFHWIYDCGTSSRKPLLQTAIDNFVDRTHEAKPTVEVIAVSHFDKDHISGLVSLLKKVKVNVLLLPYMPLSQRISLAFALNVRHRARAMDFLINPVEVLIGLPDVSVERIVLVPATAGEAPPELFFAERNPNTLEGMRVDSREPRSDEERDDVDAMRHNGGNPIAIEFLRDGGSLRADQAFELVPYNDASLWARVNPRFRDAVERHRTSLMAGPSDRTRERALSDLKKTYDDCFGDSPEKRNLISLFLYAGPINVPRALGAWVCREVIRRNCREMDHECFGSWGRDYKCGLLYSGDGSLNTPRRLEQLTNYLGAARIARLACFQVMHHGALPNWHSKVPETLAPLVSVFSSDPGHLKYRHPSEIVRRSFRDYGPVQVDKENGFQLHFRNM
jgi:hypothetical protein